MAALPPKQSLTVNHVLQRCKINAPAQVRRMNVCGCALEDIAVMQNFANVELCSLSANDISELEAFRNCNRLQELYLRKNRIADFAQILHLSHLPIKAAGLSDNPIASHPQYRKFVISALPQLERLDDMDVTSDERRDAETAVSDPFSAAHNMGVMVGMTPMPGRPGSAHGQQGSAANTPMNSIVAGGGGGPGAAPLSLAARRQQKQQETERMMNNNNITNNNNNNSHDNNIMSTMSNTSPASPSSGKVNRYNGDDVPIGGGGRVAAPPTAAVRATTTTTTMTSKANNNNKLKIRRDPFASADVMEGGPSSSTTTPTGAKSDNFYTQLQGIAPVASSSPSAAQTSISEDAAVKAVKVLLDSMSSGGIAEIKRHLLAL